MPARTFSFPNLCTVFSISQKGAGGGETSSCTCKPHNAVRSHSPIIRPPVLDGFLDIRAGKFLVEGTLDQFWDFGVRGETKGHELALAEFRDTRAKRLGKKLHEAQALFEANEPVLHLQRIESRLKRHHEQSCGEQDYQEGMKAVKSAAIRQMVEEIDQRDDQGNPKNGEHEGVEQGIKAGVIGESLGRLFGHRELLD